ncbi:glycosyltransferase family 25 protein [Parabacteroides goldsteinii]|jgi:glycosyl transferase family 25
MMKIKTYIINLKESVERKDQVLREVSRSPFMDIELVEAVNGRMLMEEQVEMLFDWKNFSYRYGHEPLPGEIGCTLSHRECYRRLLRSDEEYALVLEDDVLFQQPEDVAFIFDHIDKVMKSKKRCILTLASHFYYLPKSLLMLGGYGFYRVLGAYGTCAYLVNRGAARKLLSVERSSIVADDFKYISRNGICVIGIYPYLALGASSAEIIDSEIQVRKQEVRDIPFRYRMIVAFWYRVYGCLLRLKIMRRR